MPRYLLERDAFKQHIADVPYKALGKGRLGCLTAVGLPKQYLHDTCEPCGKQKRPAVGIVLAVGKLMKRVFKPGLKIQIVLTERSVGKGEHEPPLRVEAV